MAFHAPLGESDFRQIRKLGAVYVDKTAAITEIALSATKVFLFTRPRRFGKSTLLSTLYAFFQRPDLIGEDTCSPTWRCGDPSVRRHTTSGTPCCG